MAAKSPVARMIDEACRCQTCGSLPGDCRCHDAEPLTQDEYVVLSYCLGGDLFKIVRELKRRKLLTRGGVPTLKGERSGQAYFEAAKAGEG